MLTLCNATRDTRPECYIRWVEATRSRVGGRSTNRPERCCLQGLTVISSSGFSTGRNQPGASLQAWSCSYRPTRSSYPCSGRSPSRSARLAVGNLNQVVQFSSGKKCEHDLESSASITPARNVGSSVVRRASTWPIQIKSPSIRSAASSATCISGVGMS